MICYSVCQLLESLSSGLLLCLSASRVPFELCLSASRVPFERFATLFVSFSSPFRAVCYSVCQLLESLSSGLLLCLSASRVPFERFATCLSASRVLFERSSFSSPFRVCCSVCHLLESLSRGLLLCLSASRVPFARFAALFVSFSSPFRAVCYSVCQLLESLSSGLLLCLSASRVPFERFATLFVSRVPFERFVCLSASRVPFERFATLFVSFSSPFRAVCERFALLLCLPASRVPFERFAALFVSFSALAPWTAAFDRPALRAPATLVWHMTEKPRRSIVYISPDGK